MNSDNIIPPVRRKIKADCPIQHDSLKVDAPILLTAKNTKPTEKGGAFYNVSATFNASGSASDALAMPETSDTLAMTDALSFSQLDSDALAGASASSLTELDDKSAWKDLTLA